jgi:hypothetical protein
MFGQEATVLFPRRWPAAEACVKLFFGTNQDLFEDSCADDSTAEVP